MFNYPLNLSFKVVAINPQVQITDNSGNSILYVRQKAFALRENVRVFTNEDMDQLLYEINADRIIDWNAQYTINDSSGRALGTVKREGMKSLWSASYAIYDGAGIHVGTVKEENPWIKVLDGILSEIPFLGMLVNPAYLVEWRGRTSIKLQKKPAVFEGKFEITSLQDLGQDDENLLMPAIIMIMMLERMRG